MAALTGPRPQTDRLGNEVIPPLWKIPVAAGVKIWAGALVVIRAGYARPGTVAVGDLSAGRAEATVDNTTGAAGDKVVTVRRGPHAWNNSASGDLIAQADVGKIAYIVDDQTVALTSNGGTRSPCGVILQLEGSSPIVETGVNPQLAALLADT